MKRLLRDCYQPAASYTTVFAQTSCPYRLSGSHIPGSQHYTTLKLVQEKIYSGRSNIRMIIKSFPNSSPGQRTPPPPGSPLSNTPISGADRKTPTGTHFHKHTQRSL
ncbi:hypothetical protein HBI56_054680 [Parastagonospora nodorum]|uniref:Uncharacterized protein n=1 Tax=Phaeosphaeria nodorum (strain SN15 / ATCC MYA-4574 / FGSC 10173) TaxID=321614 RepID=A0A7U2ICG8_PHANO|nr:hypothetical protein HBI09_144910 [Parastagonospora nodorum]QRD07327.1 hypothetical protein JI435_447230 [Parastagonospora nodorum SN15]KAH4050845.1 hypothetical protein HBH49_123950 [Parastagonospora nodorum]KAH4301883.1 hypothetical protein HBI01_098470 [Parastagonospora nodorum]KAH4343838.1 hypothetical protein HBH98_140400 [Parastagonospora nodorum]